MSIPQEDMGSWQQARGVPHGGLCLQGTAQLGEAAEGLSWGLYTRKGISFQGEGSSRDLT